MALSASTVWEVRNVADFASASDTNGGGFVTGASGTDYSFASLSSGGAAKYTLSNGVTNGTTTVATTSASADMVGNIAYISGGTGSITGGWYQIVSQTTGVSIVVDRSTGLTTGTGVGITIGGCLATPGLLGTLMTVGGMNAWIKYSTTAFTLTTSTPGSGGPISLNQSVTISGYDATRGDRDGNLPVIAWPSSGVSAGSAIFIVATTQTSTFANFSLNCNSVNNVAGFSFGSYGVAIGCVCQNAAGTGSIYGFFGAGFSQSCYTYNCKYGFFGGMYIGCYASSCTTCGFYASGATQFIGCLAYSCAIGFNPGGATTAERCTADTCTTGFSVSGPRNFMSNCIASNNTTGVSANGGLAMVNTAYYNNSTNLSGTPQYNFNPITLTAQPYVTAGSQFAPNATANGGAALRGAAIGVYSQTDNQDIGAVQHSDPGGGPTGFVMMVKGGTYTTG